ncbi:uncharacterized protein LOC144950799 isoform X3 [Lampetra fluviatilis]
MNADGRSVRIIEWEDLDKRKFFTLGIVMTLAIRAAVYPASLIRTRLQVQKGKSVYKGTADAFAKIARAEGARGLYRGFLVNALTIVSGQAYVTTYELARLYVSRFSDSNALKSLVAGGCASLVAQSITVPIDIISQHLMIQAMGRKAENPGETHAEQEENGRTAARWAGSTCAPRKARPCRWAAGASWRRRSCGRTGRRASTVATPPRFSPTSPIAPCGGPSTTPTLSSWRAWRPRAARAWPCRRWLDPLPPSPPTPSPTPWTSSARASRWRASRPSWARCGSCWPRRGPGASPRACRRASSPRCPPPWSSSSATRRSRS